MKELCAELIDRHDLPGPEFLDLVEFLGEGGKDFAVLHTADGSGGPSIIGVGPAVTIELTAGGELRSAESEMTLPEVRAGVHPLAAFEEMRQSVRLRGSDDMCGSWIGHIGYDIGRVSETLPGRAADDTRMPLLRWSLYDGYLRRSAGGEWSAYAYAWNVPRMETAAGRLERMSGVLVEAARRPVLRQVPVSTVVAGMAREKFLATVAQAREYIAAGDIYQANVAQRWSVRTDAAPAAVYRRLCETTPAAYSAFLKFGDRAIISASPELLLDVHGNALCTRPIKGTRPRDLGNAANDAFLALDLHTSEKDKAELAMIVDLLRNDLGRVSKFGSVKVTEARMLERLPTLWHTVAEIRGELAGGLSWPAVIAALCPGGSVTGAPKIRAMEIIDELETHRRGLYCGNIGYISSGSRATLNIAIRTIQMIGQTAHVWAGAGIVADSDAALEYAETVHKAAALFRALGLDVPRV